MSNSDPVIVGTGPSRVLALHGWFGSSQGWGHFLDYVDREKFTYALLDYRGYGGRKDVAGEFTLEEIASDALAAADALGWDSFNLLGHSMGGAAIQHVLVAAPDRVQKLYALSGVPASGVPLDDEAYGMFSAAPESFETRVGLTHYATGGRLPNSFAQRIATESQENSTVEAFAAYLPRWVRGDISAKVAGLPHPVKIVVGEHDPGVNEEAVRFTWAQYYPNCELEVAPNVGHYAMYEAPAWFAASVEEFFLREGA